MEIGQNYHHSGTYIATFRFHNNVQIWDELIDMFLVFYLLSKRKTYNIKREKATWKLTILYQIFFQDQRDCNTTLREKINIYNSQIQPPSWMLTKEHKF